MAVTEVLLYFSLDETIESFTAVRQQALSEQLTSVLACHSPACTVDLVVSAASVNVEARLVVASPDASAGVTTAAVQLATLSASELSITLAVSVTTAFTVSVQQRTALLVVAPPPPGVSPSVSPPPGPATPLGGLISQAITTDEDDSSATPWLTAASLAAAALLVLLITAARYVSKRRPKLVAPHTGRPRANILKSSARQVGQATGRTPAQVAPTRKQTKRSLAERVEEQQLHEQVLELEERERERDREQREQREQRDWEREQMAPTSSAEDIHINNLPSAVGVRVTLPSAVEVAERGHFDHFYTTMFRSRGERWGVGFAETLHPGALCVSQIADGSPAELASLQLGDEIVAVDGQVPPIPATRPLAACHRFRSHA